MPTALDDILLNSRQRKFIAAFLLDPAKNGTKAAELAGYKNPSVAAHRLIRNDKIKRAIQEADKASNNALVLSVEQRKQALSEIIQSGEEHNRIKSIDVLNKMDSIYIERQHLSFDNMDNQQLNSESAEIMRIDGWICISPDDPSHARVKEMLE